MSHTRDDPDRWMPPKRLASNSLPSADAAFIDGMRHIIEQKCLADRISEPSLPIPKK
jgi:hypothetical protein